MRRKVSINELRTGDMVFYQPPLFHERFSALVSLVSLSQITHVGLVLDSCPGHEDQKKRFLWHSMFAPFHCHVLYPASDGVHVENFNNVMNKVGEEWQGKWWCRQFPEGVIRKKLIDYRPKKQGTFPFELAPCSSTDEETRQVHAAIRSLIKEYSETSYPIRSMDWFWSMMLMPWGDPHLFHCSAFVVDFYERIGVIDASRTSTRNAITPAALANDDGCLTNIRWHQDVRPEDELFEIQRTYKGFET